MAHKLCYQEVDQSLASELSIYPEEPFVDKETAIKAIKDMQKVKEVILNSLKEYLSSGRP